MFAYLATCAEYGLQHEPISLGICTNWPSDKVPAAPIIHYCQPIFGNDGSAIFNKHTYEPWSRLETDVEPARDYGRDLVALINRYVDGLTGRIGPAPAYSRPARCEGIKEGHVLDDLLLERAKDGASLWLNGSGKAVWEMCSGLHDVDAIASELSARFTADHATILAQVRGVVGQLHAIEFVELK